MSDGALPASEAPAPHGDPLAAEVPTEPPQLDTYGTAEAARLLGVSDRRVRQMVAEGQLPGERDDAGVLSLPQEAVNDERARRRKEARTESPRRKPGGATATDVDAIAAAVEAAVARVLVGQLELTAQAQSQVEVERKTADAERARRLELEAEVATLRARLEVATAPPPVPEPAPRQRWWRRR